MSVGALPSAAFRDGDRRKLGEQKQGQCWSFPREGKGQNNFVCCPDVRKSYGCLILLSLMVLAASPTALPKPCLAALTCPGHCYLWFFMCFCHYALTIAPRMEASWDGSRCWAALGELPGAAWALPSASSLCRCHGSCGDVADRSGKLSPVKHKPSLLSFMPSRLRWLAEPAPGLAAVILRGWARWWTPMGAWGAWLACSCFGLVEAEPALVWKHGCQALVAPETRNPASPV